jgi:hypothetical protein
MLEIALNGLQPGGEPPPFKARLSSWVIYRKKIVAILVINCPIFEDQNNLFDALSGCFSITFRPISI